MTRFFPNTARELLILLFLSVVFGAVRQIGPGGIAWQGRWPTSDMTAQEAYSTIAQDSDPPFVSLTDAIRLHAEPNVVFIDARILEDFKLAHIQHPLYSAPIFLGLSYVKSTHHI